MTVALIGWFGTLLYLVNHAYISLNKQWKKRVYYSGNAIAAVCLICSSYVAGSWQAVFINGFWAVISVALLCDANLRSITFSKNFFYVMVGAMLTYFLGEFALQQTLNLALLGWTSAFIFSACYLLFSTEKMLPRFYLCWNAFAAIALLPQLWLDQNWPVFSLEIAWAAISIYGAARRFKEVHLIQ
jgi:hypothetical protein